MIATYRHKNSRTEEVEFEIYIGDDVVENEAWICEFSENYEDGEFVMFRDCLTVQNYEMFRERLNELFRYYRADPEEFEKLIEVAKNRAAAEHDFIEPNQL